MPANAIPTAAFMDGTVRGIVSPHTDGVTPVDTGDPGQYDPFTGYNVGQQLSMNSHNKAMKPFNSSSVRALELNIYGKDSPGVGTYRAALSAQKQLYKNVDDNRCVFQSKSLQRPSPANEMPGPEAYNPVMTSVYQNISNAAASYRGSADRFVLMTHPDALGGSHSMSETNLGPGAYESHDYGTVAMLSKRSMSRMSKLQPGFGTICPQRELPHKKSITPDPGSCECRNSNRSPVSQLPSLKAAASSSNCPDASV